MILSNQREPAIYHFADFRLEVEKRRLVDSRGQLVPLTSKVFETLLFLVRHSGTVVDKNELMHAVWPDTVVEENNLSQTISALRRTLGERAGEHRYIVTIPGRGFSFVASVSTETEGAGEPAIRDSHLKRHTPANFLRKNVSGVVILVGFVAVALATVAVLGWRPGSNAVRFSTVKTFAVLPFKPLVPESHNRALELGMADTLIAKLSNSRKLVVRPMSAVRKYGGVEQDPLAAGRELKVEAVLDGSIQQQGDRVRVTARVLSISDGRQLWSGQFDEELTNIFDVQDSISERVSRALARIIRVFEDKRSLLCYKHVD
jgi:DNA-binding winged helix-turn-helix (wHTH) protein/TolB-like protein